MPPVFGPSSPSLSRLKSCAGIIGTTETPSQIANTDTSGPSRYSSMTTREHAAACARATSRSRVTTTPLPAASASSFTTYGGPNASSAASTSSAVSQMRAIAVGMSAAAMISLAKAFDPSIRAASAPGPKQAIPLLRTASATPATNGASGPTTTRSTPSSAARSAIAVPSSASPSCSLATDAMPGLPGTACSSSTSRSRRERPGQRVLAPSPADQQNLHRASQSAAIVPQTSSLMTHGRITFGTDADGRRSGCRTAPRPAAGRPARWLAGHSGCARARCPPTSRASPRRSAGRGGCRSG